MRGIRKRKSSGAPEKSVRNMSQGSFLEDTVYFLNTHPSKPVRTGSQIRREDRQPQVTRNLERQRWHTSAFLLSSLIFINTLRTHSHLIYTFPIYSFLLKYFETRLADLCYMWGASQKRWLILPFCLIPLTILSGTCLWSGAWRLFMYSIPT